MKLVAACLLALIPSAAFAQSTAAGSFSFIGVVESIGPFSVTVKTDSGANQTFEVGPKLLVLKNRSISLTEIQPSDFVASAAVRAQDGKLHSTELRVFPDALRGVGEGQRPMNDSRNQTMTNATVTGTAVVNGSNRIKVKFAGGESELILDPGVPVTRIEQVPREAVQAGQKVRVQGTTGNVVGRLTIQ